MFLMFLCQKKHVFMPREERGKGEKMAFKGEKVKG